MNRIVVIGGGQAAIQTVISLRQLTYAGNITIISDDAYAAYQRPPLSKDFYSDDKTIDDLYIKPLSYYDFHDVDLRLNTKITAIDAEKHVVICDNNETIPYNKLVLATGTRVRNLPMAGAEHALGLRSFQDAANIKKQMLADNCQHIICIGGGFIGLEIGAAALKLGKSVTVFEMAPRILERACLPKVSEIVANHHIDHGMALKTSCGVASITQHGNRYHVTDTNGDLHECDMVLNTAGVVPNTDCGAGSGLLIDNGFVVDSYMRTNIYDIFAIGDVAAHANIYAAGIIRLESIQNAIDQAKIAAKTMMAADKSMLVAYRNVPWFWSYQGDLKLQMVGLSHSSDATIVKGDNVMTGITLYNFGHGKLQSVDTINHNGNHMAARRILEQALPLTYDVVNSDDFDLKAFYQQHHKP